MNEEYKAIIDSLIKKQDSIQNIALSQELGYLTNIIFEQVNQMGLSDWLSIIASIVGVIVTIIFGYIAFKFSRKQDKQNEELSTTTTKIGDETGKLFSHIEELKKVETDIERQVNKLADINRPFKETFPEIIDQIRRLCLDAVEDNYDSELYIMNRTSSFGKIHTFNPKFISHYDIQNIDLSIKTKELIDLVSKKHRSILSHLDDDFEKSIALFTKDIEDLSLKILSCGLILPKNKFKMIVFDSHGDNCCLVRDFIQDYFNRVNTESDISNKKGLKYFDFNQKRHNYKGGFETFDEISKQELENKIKESVIKSHNDLLKDIETDRNSIGDTWLKKSDSIPMQIYLLKREKNSKTEYKTFVINAMNTDTNHDKDRSIHGLFSTEQSLYSVFKTIFDKTFNKQ
jgi:archaellum component FlaC